jgi:uncharacterized protein YjbI with pentapeptide repeats
LDLQIALAALGRLRRSGGSFHPDRVDLQSIDLRDAELQECDFGGFDLSGGNFERANLLGASFCFAELRDARFEGANLHRADFTGASVQGMDARGANLQQAVLRRAFGGVNFQNANLSHADAEWSLFGGSDFRRAKLNGTLFYGATFQFVKIQGVDFSKTLGLPDLYLGGGCQKDDKTILPGKSLSQANAEANKKPPFC